MRKLINLLNSRNSDGVGDNRHILIDDEWPDKYYDSDLSNVVDKILREFEKLSGGNFINDMYDNIDSYNYNRLKINALDFCYRAISLIEACDRLDINSDDLKSEIKLTKNNFKLNNLKTKQDLEQRTKQIVQMIYLDNKERKEKNEKKGLIIFEDLIAPLEIYFKKDINRDITCTMYISYKKIIKSHKRNG